MTDWDHFMCGTRIVQEGTVFYFCLSLHSELYVNAIKAALATGKVMESEFQEDTELRGKRVGGFLEAA